MDDRRFDALVKSLASGRSRRSVLKGLVGLGGATAIGGTLMEPSAEAARRPTPTPKPVKCPGNQHWDGTRCVCTSGETCGAACCLIGSECCDGSCCFGHCYGEELCCPYDNWCDAANQCCQDGETCCEEQGCIVIEEGDCGCDGECPQGFECCGGQCCATGFCAGEVCCALGVCGGACLTDVDQACCGTQPYDPVTHYCCAGTVVQGACCASSGCETGFECCGGTCCASGNCIFEECCERGICQGGCMQEGLECCADLLYDPNDVICCGNVIFVREGNVCCDDEIQAGSCCENSDCGSCGNCVDYRCGNPTC